MDPDTLCTGCLCPGRKLTPLRDEALHSVYRQFLTEIPLSSFKELYVLLCFECIGRLRGFSKFQQRVTYNYQQFLQVLNKGTPEDFKLLAKSPQLQTHNVQITSYPEVPELKPDVKSDLDLNKVEIDLALVKTEPEVVTDSCHSEPRTFVNELKEINKKPSKKRTKKKRAKKTNDFSENSANSDAEFNDFNDANDYLDDIQDNSLEKEIKPKLKIKVKKKCKEVDISNELDGSTDNIDCLTCDKCMVNFRNEKLLNKHILKEHKIVDIPEKTEQEKPVVCDICKEVSACGRRHQLHMANVHQQRPQCSLCGRMFSSMKTYRSHLNVIHKGQNRFPCPRCGKVYQWKSNLWRHMRTHRALDDGELYCSPCDKKFASVATYKQHLKISKRHVSETEFDFVCSECGKKFVSKTRLRDHVDWEHLHKVNYRCQLCNKPFKSGTSLYVHIQNVHKSKDVKDNLCHVCGKSYQNSAKLKYHIVAMHTASTPYSCGKCAASFSWYSSLYRHNKEVHDKVKLQPNRKRGKKPDVLPLPPAAAMPHSHL